MPYFNISFEILELKLPWHFPWGEFSCFYSRTQYEGMPEVDREGQPFGTVG